MCFSCRGGTRLLALSCIAQIFYCTGSEPFKVMYCMLASQTGTDVDRVWYLTPIGAF